MKKIIIIISLILHLVIIISAFLSFLKIMEIEKEVDDIRSMTTQSTYLEPELVKVSQDPNVKKYVAREVGPLMDIFKRAVVYNPQIIRFHYVIISVASLSFILQILLLIKKKTANE